MIGLGTAQFGMNYGVSNSVGQTPLNEVAAILEKAKESGISHLDTAPLYDKSEKVLGQVLSAQHMFKIVTKTSKGESAEALKHTFYDSLSNLKTKSVYGLLVHRASDLFLSQGKILYRALLELKEKGEVKKIGVSVYSQEEIDRIISQYKIDLIQLPINIFDQRLVNNGTLKRLKDLGIEIHSRSVFLQGLLLMEVNDLPPFFSKIKSHLTHFRSDMQKQGLSPLGGLLSYVQSIKEIDVVIVGVNTQRQFTDILNANKNRSAHLNYIKYAIEDETILNPSRWLLK